MQSVDYRVPRTNEPRHFEPYVVVFKYEGETNPRIWSCFATDAHAAQRTFEITHEREPSRILFIV